MKFRQPKVGAMILLPIEVLAIVSVLIALIYIGIGGHGFFYPATASLTFTAAHYIGPMTLGLVLPVLIGLAYQGARRRISSLLARDVLWQRARQTVALTVIVLLHFNFKLWAQLVNKENFDVFYLTTDIAFSNVIDVIIQVNTWLIGHLGLWPNAYHDLFVAMFVVSLGIHGLHSRKWVFDKLVFVVALVLMIGGVSYSFAPALGPFVFDAGNNPMASQIQSYMLNFYKTLIETKGASYQPDYFVAGVAAMPSLHVAHLMVLVWHAARYCRPLAFLYGIPALYIVTEAIAARWHYLIDLVAGVVVAIVCMMIADAVFKDQKGQ